MYKKKSYYLPGRIDREITYFGKYGKKGETRGKRSKKTSESQRRENQWQRQQRVDRKICANFTEGESSYITFTYEVGNRPGSAEELKRDKVNLLAKMRREYKKAGVPFKWIFRAEIGKRGAAHMHVLVNDVPGADMKKLASKCWKKGHTGIKDTYDLKTGNLAEYFVKLAPDEIKGQMTWMDEKERKAITMYSCSRNLIVPEPEVKEYPRWTVERMIRDGIKPTPGYMILPKSVRYGTNPFNGESYLHYKEIKVENYDGKRFEIKDRQEAPPWEYKREVSP